MIVNLDQAEFDEPRDHPGFRARRARIGHQLGTRKLGVSLWEVPPGEAAYPYHLHLGEEELLLVLDGRPSVRTPQGWQELAPSDLVTFPTGEEGAHQIVNRTESTVRFLALSSQFGPEVVIQPDSGKIIAAERRGGGDDDGFRAVFRIADEVGHLDGETPPAR